MSTTAKQVRNLRKWVAALESGEYKQARSDLRKGDSYCCLGVWCQVGVAGAWDGERFLPRRKGVNLLFGNIEEIRGDLSLSEDEEERYIAMNDDQGKTFKQIAKAIRKAHPEVFA